MAVERTVDSNYRPVYNISSPMVNTTYVVKPSQDGFCFYGISTTSGNLPQSLLGKYTSAESAIKDLKDYLNKLQKPSISVRRDEKSKERVKNATAAKSNDKDNPE